jgi:prenyltransferase beta subunit
MQFFVFRCQTYEGGFSGHPGLEAHGGYSFCGIAALVLLGKPHLCDLQSLLVGFPEKRVQVDWVAATCVIVTGEKCNNSIVLVSGKYVGNLVILFWDT